GVYDRSPCGTGTSAKLACLAEEGKLKPGQTWTQESITGTTFQASYEEDPRNTNRIIPKIRGKAFITAETTLFFDDQDPSGF
ncbi:MAG: proline racemase family protein, partial [SAR324 cluster bacterium]|nr:proline racemase family protein [SAR324 cluster bacterium]